MPKLAKYGAPERPLRIGEIEIPCYVLQDGTRVLAQRGLQSGLGLSEGGGKTGARRIVELLESLAEKGIDVRNLVARANCPIRFIPPHGGNAADGFEATILPDVCAVLIEACRLGKLGKRREHLAERAAAVIRLISASASSRVGCSDIQSCVPSSLVAMMAQALGVRKISPMR